MARVTSKFSAAGQKCREDSIETRVPVDVSRTGLMSRMATSYDDRHIGSYMDELTVMNDDILPESSSLGDSRYQRNVSVACVVPSERLTSQSNFGYLDTKCKHSSIPLMKKRRRISLLGSRHYMVSSDLIPQPSTR